jgi:hypothetical protein
VFNVPPDRELPTGSYSYQVVITVASEEPLNDLLQPVPRRRSEFNTLIGRGVLIIERARLAVANLDKVVIFSAFNRGRYH